MNLKNTITQAMARAMLAMSAPSADLERYIYHNKPVHTPNHTRVSGVAKCKRAAKRRRNRLRNKR